MDVKRHNDGIEQDNRAIPQEGVDVGVGSLWS